MKDDVLSEIAYLDDFARNPAPGALPSDMVEFVRAVIQLEMAKHARTKDSEELSSRLAALESRMEMLMRAIANQRGRPPVQYVVVSRKKEVIATAATEPPQATPKLPAPMVVFYGAGLICSLAFAVLLELSAVGIVVIHPFLSLLGLVGGLGWLTTAWTDLLLWKRENLSANEFSQEERTFPATNPR